MKIRIKTLFYGKAGIPEKYYKEALKKREDLKIIFGNGIMKIQHRDLKVKKVGRSEEPLKDKWGRGEYYLVYFNWKPMTRDEREEDFVKTYLV